MIKVSKLETFCYDVGMYPNTFYRVTVKAFITNEIGQVLVVREGNDFWSLPGGGLDHGESQTDCLRREIMEELGVDGVVVEGLVHSKSFYLDRKDAWLLWNVYKARIDTADFKPNDGITDAKYVDPQEYEHSNDMFEKSVFEVSKCVY